MRNLRNYTFPKGRKTTRRPATFGHSCASSIRVRLYESVRTRHESEITLRHWRTREYFLQADRPRCLARIYFFFLLSLECDRVTFFESPISTFTCARMNDLPSRFFLSPLKRCVSEVSEIDRTHLCLVPHANVYY